MKTIIIIVLLGLIFIPPYSFAQLPDNDSTWHLILNEEFIGYNIDTSLWEDNNSWGQRHFRTGCDHNGDEIPDDTAFNTTYLAYIKWHTGETPHIDYFPNCELDSGILKIFTKKEDYIGKVWNWFPCPNDSCTCDSGKVKCFDEDLMPFHYTTGLLSSLLNYRFGYFEIRCKIPEPPTGKESHGLGPNFWLWEGCSDFAEYATYSEIDIFEFSGADHSVQGNDTIWKPNYYTSNSHFLECSPSDTSCNQIKDTTWYHYANIENSAEVGSIDFSIWHTFGLDWRPNSLIYYIDRQPVFVSPNPFVDRYCPMRIIIDLNVPSFNFCDVVLNPYNIFPYIYEVDYVKIWWLNQQCNTTLGLCSFDPLNYNYAIYKSISLGGSGCTPTITDGNDVVLRATDGILLDKGFTVELGASLLTEITPCQDQEIYDRSQNSGYDNFPDQPIPHPGYIKMGHY